MKNVLYILVCLSLASMASALSITNGNFEAQSGTVDAGDVEDWYDYGNAEYQAGPWFRGDGAGTINTTGCLFMSGNAVDTSEDGGHKAYVYQSIGNADGTQAITLSLQWGAASFVDERYTGDGDGGNMGLTVMILESDGTFEAGEWGRIDDVYGADGVTEITRTTIVRDLAPGVAVDEVFTLNISGATAGRELFIRINAYNAGNVDPSMSIDNITIANSVIAPQSPKDDARFIAVERTSTENDLIFRIADPNNAINSVDILFGPENDPALSLNPAYKIVSGKPVSNGTQYTIALNTELAADLSNDTQYYWKILAYEPNGMGTPKLVAASTAWSFKTVQEGPYLGPVSPSVKGVFAGQDVVFSVLSSKADTFQWYKEGVTAPLSNGADYSGVTTDTLTVKNAQLDDAGFYYCVATETASTETATSQAPGELVINRLMHHFPFDSAVSNITLDTIGGVQAQLMGGASVASEPNSIVGSYLRLDNPGSNLEDTQYANILDASAFDQRQITVSAWFRMSTLNGKQPVWAFGQNDPNYWDFYPQYQNNEDEDEEELDSARSEFRVRSNVRVLDGSYYMHSNQWYFVTLTNHDGTVRMYLDGEYVGISDMFPMPELIKTIAYIGRRIHNGDYPMFNGYIDELKIYNYAMSSVEIGQAYLAVKTDIEYVCNEEIYDLDAYDYDANCRVDLADFAQIAAQWLEDHRIFPN